MTSLLPEVEGWIKLAGAAVAVLMALAVPVRSWIVEDRRYRAQTAEALAAASRTVVNAVTPTPQLLADSLALRDLATAIGDLAAVLRDVMDGGEQGGSTRLADAVRELRRIPPGAPGPTGQRTVQPLGQ